MLDRVRTLLNAQGLWRSDALLLVAVSGGPDSLCLLHLLHRLRTLGGPALHVVHLDHGARGAQAAAEAEAVAALAAAWGIPATIEYRDVPALAHASRRSLMATARQVRYALLASLAVRLGAHAVAVAHQADDQAETILLHLLRGAGLAGLRGMRAVVPWDEWASEMRRGGDAERRRGGEASSPPASSPPASSPPAPSPPASSPPASSPPASSPPAPLLRPLLATTRAEIVAYCARHALQAADDPSNRSPRYTRSRVRQWLPQLAAENPQLISSLGRTAQILADDYDYLQQQLNALWPTLATTGHNFITLQRAAWNTLHPAMQRHALRRAAAHLGAPELSFEQIAAARSLTAHPGRHMDLTAHVYLVVEQQTLVLVRGLVQPYADVPQLTSTDLSLVNPGITPIGNDWFCSITTVAPAQPDRWWLALDPRRLDGPLSLRCRQPGDRFYPLGGQGSRKLQDFFVDQKISRALRAAWPLLVTPNAIVWVVGIRPDRRFHGAPQDSIWVGMVQKRTSSCGGNLGEASPTQ